MKEKVGGDKNLYDVQRDQVAQIDKDFSALKKLLYEDDGVLRSPK
jgi:hypothetical protein